MNLIALPNEILTRILSYLDTDTKTIRIGPASVCRHLYQICDSPMLLQNIQFYQNNEIDEDNKCINFKAFVKFLTGFSNSGNFSRISATKRLIMNIGNYSILDLGCTETRVFSLATSLKTLLIRCYDINGLLLADLPGTLVHLHILTSPFNNPLGDSLNCYSLPNLRCVHYHSSNFDPIIISPLVGSLTSLSMMTDGISHVESLTQLLSQSISLQHLDVSIVNCLKSEKITELCIVIARLRCNLRSLALYYESGLSEENIASLCNREQPMHSRIRANQIASNNISGDRNGSGSSSEMQQVSETGNTIFLRNGTCSTENWHNKDDHSRPPLEETLATLRLVNLSQDFYRPEAFGIFRNLSALAVLKLCRLAWDRPISDQFLSKIRPILPGVELVALPIEKTWTSTTHGQEYIYGAEQPYED